MSPPRFPVSRRRLVCLVLLAAATALLAASPAALAGTFLPESGGSPNADRISTLYEIALVIGAVIFVGVQGALIYALVKFRRRRGAVAAQVRGNTRLEVTWTLGAALILVVLSVLTFAWLGAIRNPDNSPPGGLALASASSGNGSGSSSPLPPDGRSLRIQVNGQQYVWRFTYPGAGANGLDAPYAYEEMVVPTDTTVTLDIVAQDVVHSWWIPKLGGKFDAVPGYTNHTWFLIHKPGVYSGQCAELCGRNHADMVARVRAVAPAEFLAWLAQRKADIADANAAAAATRGQLSRRTGAQSVQLP